MDIFKVISELNDDKLHPKYKLLRDEFYYRNSKKIINEWVDGFVDRDQKIIKEFQTTFHSSFWEFYLHAVFKELGWTVNYKNNRPDFIISSPEDIYVEAVVSEIKNGGPSESERTHDHVLDMLEPLSTREQFSSIIDEAIARHSNSISSKHKKYTGYTAKEKINKGYKDCPWVKEDKPYVIALASYDQISYGREYIYSMMALLYNLYYCPETEQYYKRDYIKKPNTDSNIKLGLFTDNSLEDVSAIIFCNTLTLGKLSSLSKSRGSDLSYVINIRHDMDPPHYKIQEVGQDSPEQLLDGLYVFHNPYAKNNLPLSELNKTGLLQFSMVNKDVEIKGTHFPIVARYCQPNVLVPTLQMKDLFKDTAASNYNKTQVFETL